MDNNENIVVKPEMPMKWFKFYKILLIIWAAGYLLYGAGSVILAITGAEEMEVPTGVFIGLAILSLALCALCLYLFLGLRKFKLKAYKVNIWFTIVLSIFGAAGCGIASLAAITSGIGTVGAVAMGAAYSLFGLIYPYCSIMYFEKRKFLFLGDKAEGNEAEEESKPAELSETAEENEPEEGLAAEVKKPAKKLSLQMKYLIAHIIVSVLAIVLTFVIIPDDLSQYLNGDLLPGDEIGLEKAEGKYDEVITDDEQIKKAFDEIAVFMGYTDSDELMTEVETIEKEFDNEIDLHGMEMKEAYEFIFTEYFAVPSYEDALFSVNPHTEEVITSFIEYQDYVMMEIESYYEI